MNKKQVVNWFGQRGIPLTQKEITWHEVKGTRLHIILDLVDDGLFWSSTYSDEIDVIEINSSCAEVEESIRRDF